VLFRQPDRPAMQTRDQWKDQRRLSTGIFQLDAGHLVLDRRAENGVHGALAHVG
jgi:hypothetical protein